MTKNDLKKTSIQFRTLSAQVLKLDNETEFNYLIAFMNFIDNNIHIKSYLDECNTQDYNFDNILSSKHGWGPLELPPSPNELVNYIYQLLRYIKENPNKLHGICFTYSTSKSWADRYQAFMRKTVEPFVHTLRTYLEMQLIDSEDEKVDAGKKTIFLSYCQKDTCIADIVETALTSRLRTEISISRDVRDVKYKESFRKFMESIGYHNYVLMIISDHYLKSRNCMYEVLEVMRDRNYGNKLHFIIVSENDFIHYEDRNKNINANVYSVNGQTNYITYWQSIKVELEAQINKIGDPIFSIEQAKELQIVHKILLDLPDFMSYLRDCNGIPLEQHIKSNFDDIVSHM